MNLNNLIANLGVKGTAAGDVTFLILFLLVSFVLSVALGRHRILVTMLGIYASYVIVFLVPETFVDDPNTKAILLLALIVAFVVMFGRIIRANLSGSGTAYLVKSTIGAAVILGLFLSVVFSWLPAKELTQFATPTTKKFFTEDLYRFFWALAPLVYLGVVRKRID